MARASIRPPALRNEAATQRADRAAKPIVAPLPTEPAVRPAGAVEPVSWLPDIERGPRIALTIGAAAIGAVLLALPSTRPQWLTLNFAPQTRVFDLTPATALAPRDPLAEVQAVAGSDPVRRAGNDGLTPARAPAAPPAVANSPPAEAPAAAATVIPAPGAPASNAAADVMQSAPPLAAAGSVAEALQGTPATGAISALAAYDDGDTQRAERMARCELELESGPVPPPAPAPAPAPIPAESFGKTLAQAALQQTRGFGVYTDSYRRIAFPMGDVPALFGVCTDVVIRAYRAMGIDLQARVHAARVGAMDPSIAHRRTYTLRRYFASRGASLPISDFAEDYLPGDIVTYYRPQNSGSKDHIAIVADQIGPSGKPMIIHNRGWGVQIEDALFVDKITGHYRYTGSEAPLSKIRAARLGSAAKAVHKKPQN